MRERMKTPAPCGPITGNRRLGDPVHEVRAALDRSLDPACRRRAERRVRMIAALLDGGAPTLDV
ncbi:hypothetical protein [Anaeromyxobacter sp. PSR-1]|uniref:hypothetical protein n=1 Tax=unclassified Anaeromyxobacter TaxID=2620896 RepID=UPI0005E1438F|nr:hypothetical protein [Anaeromyxobacter sp. PSR-1]GAO02226.1 hypothetical protein PSR1_01097 [Anaeromyxobacter sp. PSR-1]